MCEHYDGIPDALDANNKKSDCKERNFTITCAIERSKHNTYAMTKIVRTKKKEEDGNCKTEPTTTNIAIFY